MRDQCLLWENYPPPQEAEGDICHCEESWDEGKRLGKWNRFDFWSSAPWEQSMVTLQPEKKLPLRPSLFRIFVFTFNHPAGSLIKCTAHTSIQANKTQWSPKSLLQYPPFAGQSQSSQVSGRCALKVKSPASARAARGGWEKRSQDLRTL